MATLVLAQATLLARVVAASFEGASLGEVVTELVVLGLLFLSRGALAWGFEVAGRRGAISVLSGLRSELVEARLRRHPAPLDGAQSAEVATVAVQGLEPLEAYFGRFLPQMVLAVVVPLAVLAWIVPIDPTSAVGGSSMTRALPSRNSGTNGSGESSPYQRPTHASNSSVSMAGACGLFVGT